MSVPSLPGCYLLINSAHLWGIVNVISITCRPQVPIAIAMFIKPYCINVMQTYGVSGCPALCYFAVLFPRPSFASLHSPPPPPPPPFCSFRYPWKCSLSSLISPPRLILKHCRGGDRNYQSEVHKFLSSSRNALRSSFYILLLPRRHKSPGSAQQHLLHSPPPRKPSPASPVSSPLSEICLFWTFFFFFFIQISCHHYNSHRTSSHDCSFYQPHPDPPDMNASWAATLENCLEMVAVLVLPTFIWGRAGGRRTAPSFLSFHFHHSFHVFPLCLRHLWSFHASEHHLAPWSIWSILVSTPHGIISGVSSHPLSLYTMSACPAAL